MQTIAAMLGFPNGTPIDQTQVLIRKVYERTEGTGSYGPYTIQGAMAEDAAGNRIKLKVFNHPDISRLEGQEIVIHSGRGGKGLKVVDDSYVPKGQTEKKVQVALEVSKTAEFQTVAVFHANNPAAGAAAAPGVSTPPSGARSPAKAAGTPEIVVRGDAAGMALNKAMDMLIANDAKATADLARKGKLENALVGIGGQILRASFRLQKGEGVFPETAQAEAPAPAPAPAAPPTVTAPAKPAGVPAQPEDDIPF